jgi:hypothetical protein
MTPAQMGVHVKSTHAAERQYVIASEKMAERSIKALHNGKPLIAKASRPPPLGHGVRIQPAALELVGQGANPVAGPTSPADRHRGRSGTPCE